MFSINLLIFLRNALILYVDSGKIHIVIFDVNDY